MKKILFSVAFVVTSFTGIAQVGVGTTSPHISAALDVESTTLGFLPPRMDEVEMDAITIPEEGLMVYCTDCDPKGLYYFDEFNFVVLSDQVPSGLLDTEIYSPSTGKIWMDRNLGASREATSSLDDEAYGDLYQWGRAADEHQIAANGTNTPASGITPTLALSSTPGHGDFITSTTFDWLSTPDNTLWQGVSGTNNPCPSLYRLPTDAEWAAEIATWSPQDAAGAFTSLKLTVAGLRRDSDGSLADVGIYGNYWSSDRAANVGSNIYFDSSSNSMSSENRSDGLSVRCIKN